MQIRKHIPNFVTCLGLSSGLLALYFALINNMSMTLVMLCVASVFDFLDGAFARALKVISPMGKELDSLSDMVVFGLVPGMTLHIYALHALGLQYPLSFETLDVLSAFVLFAPALIVIFSGLRLAKFNIDESQTYYFKGLPVPANALFVVSMVLFLQDHVDITHRIELAVVGLSILSAWLLVSNLKLFSLKMNNTSWKGNWYRYLFLGLSIVLIFIFEQYAFAPIIALLVLISIIVKPMGVFRNSET